MKNRIGNCIAEGRDTMVVKEFICAQLQYITNTLSIQAGCIIYKIRYFKVMNACNCSIFMHLLIIHIPEIGF